MRSKAGVESLNLSKNAGYLEVQANLLRMTDNFALGPEYAHRRWQRQWQWQWHDGPCPRRLLVIVGTGMPGVVGPFEA